MKHLFKFMAAASLILMAGCEKPLEPEEDNREPAPNPIGGEEMTLTVNSIKAIHVTESGETEGTFDYQWQDGDYLNAVAYDGPSCLGYTALDFVKQENGKAIFTGNMISEATAYKFCKGDESVEINAKGEIKYSYSSYVDLNLQQIFATSELIAKDDLDQKTELDLVLRNNILIENIESVPTDLGDILHIDFLFDCYNYDPDWIPTLHMDGNIQNSVIISFNPEKYKIEKSGTLKLDIEGSNANYIFEQIITEGISEEGGRIYEKTITTSGAAADDWHFNFPTNQIWYKTTDDLPLNVSELRADYDHPFPNNYLESISETKNEKGYFVITANQYLKTLPNGTFENVERLTEVKLPEGMITIGDYSLKGCKNLAKLSMPTSLVNIKSEALSYCGFTHLVIPKGIDLIDDDACKHNDLLKRVDILCDAQKINFKAFSSCPILETVNITGKVEELGEYSFAWNEKLKNVNLPASVKTLGKKAFMQCKKLTHLNFAENSKVEFVGENCFQNSILNSFPLMNQLTTMADYAFASTELTEAIIPSGAWVGQDSFYDCEKLEKATIESGINFIKGYNFATCWELKDITIYAGPAEYDKLNNSIFHSIQSQMDKTTNTNVALHLVKSWNDPQQNGGHGPSEKSFLGYTWKSIDFVEAPATTPEHD